MVPKHCVALALLIAAGCTVDDYNLISVVSVSPGHVTVRYSEVAGYDPLEDVSALAQAQCAELGRRAAFQWDIALISRHEPLGRSEPGPSPGTVRLRKLGFHQAHFLCVEP